MEVLAVSNKKAFTGIEVGRFLCAFAVIIWHYQHFFMAGADSQLTVASENYPLYSLFSLFYKSGHNAVPIFWMISGFIFFWKYADSVYSKKTSPRKFFVFRFSRLYPLHLTTLVTVAVLQIAYVATHGTSFIYSHNDLPHFVMQLGFASNWLNAFPETFNGPVWSVSVEVLVYTFFFIMVSFLRPGLLLTLSVAVFFKILNAFVPQNVFSCCIYFFIGGALVQLIGLLSRVQGKVLFWVCLAGVLGVGATRLGAGTIMIFAICFVGACVLFNEVFKVDLTRIARLGDLTYASYLLHFPIQLAIVLVLDGLGIARTILLSPIALVAFMTGTFGLSWIVYRRFEMPAQNWIRSTALPGRAKHAEKGDTAVAGG